MAGVLDVLEHSNIHQNQKQNRTMKKLLILLLLSVSASAQITLNLTSQNRTDLASLSDSLASKQNKITGLTTNYLPKIGENGLFGNSNIFDNGTSVGVGNVNPTHQLTVNGTTRTNKLLVNTATDNGGIAQFVGTVRVSGQLLLDGFDSALPQSVLIKATTHATSKRAIIRFENGFQLISDVNANGSYNYGFYTEGINQYSIFVQRSSNNVGIKTTAPTHDFHVNGTTRTNKLLVNTATDSGEAIQVSGNIRVTNATDGIILKTPDGTKTFKLTIDNTGNIVSTQQ
jgi:phage terminase large subunit-like protein